MKILAIDIGGTHVKFRVDHDKQVVKIPSGPKLTAKKMVAEVLKATAEWEYDVISMGYPGPVADNQPVREPSNLGRGWVGFDFKKAFGKPVKMVNDAAMQALGSYRGGNMLFLGLGTGLGTTLIVQGILMPLELAHLPYKKDRSYEDYVGLAGLKRLGKKKWRRHVEDVVGLLKFALQAEYVVLGGGNAELIKQLPPDTRLGSNAHAFTGGFRLWQKQEAAGQFRHNPE